MKTRTRSLSSVSHHSHYLASPSISRNDAVDHHYISLLNCLRYRDVELFVKHLEQFRHTVFLAASEKAMCHASEKLEHDLHKHQHQFLRQQYYALTILDQLTKHCHLQITADRHYVNRYGAPIKVSADDYAFLSHLNAALYQVNYEISEGETHPLVRYANQKSLTSLSARSSIQEWYRHNGVPVRSEKIEELYDGLCDFYVKSGLLIFTSRFLVNSIKVEKIHCDEERVDQYQKQLPALIDHHARIDTGCALSAQMKQRLLADVLKIRENVEQKRLACSFFQCRARSIYSRRLSHIDDLVTQLKTPKATSHQAVDLADFLLQFRQLMNQHTNLFSALFCFKQTKTAQQVEQLACRYENLSLKSSDLRRDIRSQVACT